MDVLITGVAGFIGSKVAKRFIAEGYKVYGIDDLSSGNINKMQKIQRGNNKESVL